MSVIVVLRVISYQSFLFYPGCSSNEIITIAPLERGKRGLELNVNVCVLVECDWGR